MLMYQEKYLFFISMLCYGGYAWLAVNFCKTHLAPKKGAGIIFPILLFFSYISADAIYQNISYLAGAAFFHAMLFGFAFLFFGGQTEKKLLAAAILDSGLNLVRELAGSAFYVAWLLAWPDAPANLGNMDQWLCMALQAAATAGAFCLLKGPAASVLEGKVRNWYLMGAIPLMAMAVLLDVAGWGATKGILLRGEDRWNLYYNQLLSHGGNLLLAASCICAACFYLSGMDRVYREQKRREQYQSQVAAYQMLEGQYRQMERLRHDMKNHVIGLLGLLEQKEWEKMKDYLNRMAEAGALGGGGETTGNKAVDALLYQKRKEAEGHGIRWESDMQVPRGCGIEDFDFCVLIGNILDNAMEACEKLSQETEKFISIQSRVRKSFFLLEARNSAKQKPGNSITCTDKENPQRHGIGIPNILGVAGNYNGAVETKLEGQVFTISILLPLNLAEEA